MQPRDRFTRAPSTGARPCTDVTVVDRSPHARPADGASSPDATRSWRRVIAPALALSLAWVEPDTASALDPDRAITQYRTRVWNGSVGPGDDNVTALAQTRDGFLWIGTTGGLVRYDGVRFTRPAADDTATFRGRRVVSMQEDARGDLWVATDADALARLRSGVLLATLSTDDGLPEGHIVDLAADTRGNLWIGTTAGLALRTPERERLTVFTTADGLASDVLTAVHVDGDDSLWIGTASAGLQHLDPAALRSDGARGPSPEVATVATEDAIAEQRARGEAGPLGEVFTSEGGLASDAVNAITRDPAGDLWVGTAGGLSRQRERGWKTYTTDNGLADNLVTTLEADRDGNLWIGTADGGLHRIANGRLNNFTTEDGLPSPNVAALAEDRDGNLWIGTLRGGLARFADAPYLLYTRREGLSENSIAAVLEDRGGDLWFGTLGGGLVQYSGGVMTKYRAADTALPSDRVQALYEQPGRGLWIGTSEGLARIPERPLLPADAAAPEGERGKRERAPVKIVAAPVSDALPLRSITAITTDARGDLWLGTRGGGLVRDSEDPEGVRRRYAAEDRLTSETITALHIDRGGLLWIGTRGGGLLTFERGTFEPLDLPEGVAADVIRVIHEDASGDLWIGTEHSGLLRVHDGVVTALTAAEGLLDDSVFQLLDDADDNFWLTGSRGLYRVPRLDLVDVSDRLIGEVHPHVLEGSRSLGTRAPTEIGSPATWRAKDGRLWFATDSGVMRINPAPAPRMPSPPVVIETIRVDGAPVNPYESLVLEPGTRSLTIDYTVPAFIEPEQLRFRYQLEGFDEDWVEAGTRRTATYTNLAPGSYRFRVAASAGADEWTSTETAVELSQRQRWYEQRALWILAGLALLLLGVGAYLLRFRAVLRRLEKHRHDAGERARALRAAESKLAQVRAELSTARERPELETWVRAFAINLARPLHATALDVWLIEGLYDQTGVLPRDGADEQGLRALTETLAEPPPLIAVREAAQTHRVLVHEDISLAAIHGAGWTAGVGVDGDDDAVAQALLGVVVIRGRATTWDEAEQRLVLCFAQQIGAAVELERLREAIDAAHSRVAMTRNNLIARGTELLTVCAVCRSCYGHSVERCPNDDGRLEQQGVLPFRVMNRYRMVKWLGQGGMGTVYEAHDQRLDRPVAIKIIRPEYFRDVNVRMRFRQEARSIAKISHPGVIALYDTGELGDGSAFLVMEKLEGLDLADLIHRFGPATPRQAALLLRQGAAALSAAHEAELVHRDIKPENIFLVNGTGGEHQVKILDFGLAKSMSIERTSLTQTGVVMGTPVYMSPEQIQGKDLDARSDLYSFACVCYEALTGRRVVESEEFARICAEVMHKSPPPLREYVPELPAAVERAFLRALAKDRDDRHATIAEWVDSFVDALETVSVPHEGWPQRVREVALVDLNAASTATTPSPAPRDEDDTNRVPKEPAAPQTRPVRLAPRAAHEDVTRTTQFKHKPEAPISEWKPPRS